MLTKTQNFIDAEQAGEAPLFYVYLNTDLTRRCYTHKSQALDESAGSGLWDGTRYYGDGLSFGAETGTVQIRPLLLTLPTINKTVTQGTKGLLTALSPTQVGYVYSEFDNFYKENSKFHFSNILTGQTSESYLGQPYEIRMGFPGLAYNDQLSLFRGLIMKSPLRGGTFKVSANAITSTLYEKYECPKSSLYTNPAQDNQPLPIVIGDMTVNAAIDEDGDGTTDKGPIPLVCIDTTNDVWAMAGHALLTTGNGQSISLYDNDGLINAGDYTYTASGDYETVGVTIAYVTFSVAPTGGVTGAYKGAPDSSGALIVNPVEAIEKILSIMGETTAFETTSYQQAINDANDQSYVCAGVVMSDNIKAYWLSNLLSCFIGSWFLDEHDEIKVQLDTGSANFMAVAGELKESMLRGGLPLDPDLSNVITRPVVDYAVSYAQIDRRFKNNSNTSYLQTYSDTSENADLSEPLQFDWVRSSSVIATLAGRIETLYSGGLKVYNGVRSTDFTLVNLEPGDYFVFGSKFQYDSDGNELTGQIGRVINISLDLANREVILDFYDTGNYLLCEPDLWDGLTRYYGDGLLYGGCRQGVARTPVEYDDFLFDGTETFDGSEYFTGEKLA